MSIAIDITHEETNRGGAYRAPVEGSARPAELTWVARGSDRVVDHTFVPPEARGQGLAKKLVDAIAADAREQGFRIVPQCPYVARLFSRDDSYGDVDATSGQ